MAKILVVFHSQTGKTARLADAVASGAKNIVGAEVRMLLAGEAGVSDLLWADGILIGTPENFGYISGMLKDFFDRTFHDIGDRLFRKPYAVFISAGNDGTGALQALERLASGWRLKRVAAPVIAVGEPTPEIIERCLELGATLAAGCDLGIF